MKEYPIPFRATMVRAILDGRKTQTRRVAKFVPLREGLNLSFSGLSPDNQGPSGWVLSSRDGRMLWQERTHLLKCPYGVPGDRLWVREAHGIGYDLTDCHPECAVFDFGDPDMVWAPGEDSQTRHFARAWKFHRPSIHMPRWASRITLEVTGVRVERVQEIDEEGARAEGVDWAAPQFTTAEPEEDPREVGYPKAGASFALSNFRRLWDSINKKRGFGWHANPWVWAITFKRIGGGE